MKSTFRKMSFNTITARDLTLPQVLDLAIENKIEFIAPWRDLIERTGIEESAKRIKDSGVGLSSLCRGGMFTAADETGRAKAINDNLRAIEMANSIGADTLVLVCGPVIGRDLHGSISMVAEGIGKILSFAESAGVTLAVEPLHPMMAASRSCITTTKQALDIIDQVGSDQTKIIIDAYHVWSDPDLEASGDRANGRVAGFHISDWVVPIQDELGSRAMPGEGCIDLNRLLAFVESCGFVGPIEVEVLSHYWWAENPQKTFQKAVSSFSELSWESAK